MKDCNERRALILMLCRTIHAVQNAERSLSGTKNKLSATSASALLQAQKAERLAMAELDRHRLSHGC